MTGLDRFDYELPTGAVAQRPIEPRHDARLLVDRGPGRRPEHRTVRDLPDLVGPGDLIVVNDTRVLPARLQLRKPTGGAVEVLLLRRHDEASRGGRSRWEALVRSSRPVPEGMPLDAGSALTVVAGGPVGEGRRMVELIWDAASTEREALEAAGQVPLPPYIHEPLDDPERYQTVYAGPRAESVAAPTAGLHLTAEVMDACRDAGAQLEAVELQVGLGTFRPIATERVEDHHMHAERYRIDPAVMAACRDAERVLAVGTTVVRALESAAATNRLDGETDLFIRRGHRFGVVDRMLTNFHVPKSSLLVMIDAFIGPRWRDLYAEALGCGYRFLSFGDAMLLDRHLGRT